MSNRNWRLPAGVGDLLPPDAWALELTRRRVLDVFRAWGFEYIDPPVVEYLDALLVGAGDDMDLCGDDRMRLQRGSRARHAEGSCEGPGLRRRDGSTASCWHLSRSIDGHDLRRGLQAGGVS